jgi:hypothetical protein
MAPPVLNIWFIFSMKKVYPIAILLSRNIGGQILSCFSKKKYWLRAVNIPAARFVIMGEQSWLEAANGKKSVFPDCFGYFDA